MPATPYHDTDVVDASWDGPANEARLSNDAGRATYERVYAWRDPEGDTDTKTAYKLTHHEVDSDGKPGAANVNGCRNALSRLPQSDVPEADHDAVRSHLQKHIDKYNSQQDESSEAADPALLARVHLDCRAWAIDPRAIVALLELDGQAFSGSAIDVLDAGARRGAAARAGGVATVPLKGILMPAGDDFFSILFGLGGGLDAFRSQLDEAVADPQVEAIVIDVDSPGGMVDFIPETAAQVRAARDKKPIVAVANTLCASAAYWLASQADEVSVTPSGEAGSIGVYRLHRDLSEAHAMRGITPTLISAGKYKVEGNPYEPLGEDARAQWQAEVDDYYRMFTADVAKGRGASQADVQAGYGEGRCLHAKQAVAAGIADRVETLSAVIKRVASPAGRAALDRRREAAADDDTRSPVVTYTPDERKRLLTVMAGGDSHHEEAA